MKKIIAAVLSAIMIITLFTFSVFASDWVSIYTPEIKMSSGEAKELEAFAKRIEKEADCPIFVNIIGSGHMKNYTAINDYNAYVIQNETGEDKGISFTHNVDTNLFNIYVAGDIENLFSEKTLNQALNAYNGASTYYDGIHDMLAVIDSVLVKEVETVEEAESTEPVVINVSDPKGTVVDFAGVLDDEYEKTLTEKLNGITALYNIDIAVVTVTSLQGKTAEEFADDYYDYNGYGCGENHDGILILYKDGKAGNRNLHITTTGAAIEIFSGYPIDEILDGVQYNIGEGDFEAAFNFYARKCEELLAPPSVSPFYIPVALLIGIAIAYFIIKARASKLKSVVEQASAGSYVVPGSSRITGSQDNFLYRNVVSTKIVRSESSGSSGSSSTHTSSSGRSHGGGGRTF